MEALFEDVQTFRRVGFSRGRGCRDFQGILRCESMARDVWSSPTTSRTMSDVPEDKGAATLAKTVLSTIRAFCQNETLLNTICMSVIFTVLDGAPYAQRSGLILCREHFKNALWSKKTAFMTL